MSAGSVSAYAGNNVISLAFLDQPVLKGLRRILYQLHLVSVHNYDGGVQSIAIMRRSGSYNGNLYVYMRVERLASILYELRHTSIDDFRTDLRFCLLVERLSHLPSELNCHLSLQMLFLRLFGLNSEQQKLSIMQVPRLPLVELDTEDGDPRSESYSDTYTSMNNGLRKDESYAPFGGANGSVNNSDSACILL